LFAVRSFFGGQGAGVAEAFCHLNYDGTEFSAGPGDITNRPILQFLLANNYTVNPVENTVHEDVIDMIVKAAQYHALIDPKGNHGPASANGEAAQFLSTVFTGWDRISSDSRKFYQTHLHILVPSVRNPGQWDTLPLAGQSNIAAIAGNLNVRLNLTKSQPDQAGSAILFATTLPKLPASVTSFRITTGAGVQTVAFAPGGVENLQDLYTKVYEGNPIGAAIPPFTSPTSTARLNVPVFIQNCMKNATAAKAAARPVIGDSPFEDLFVNLVSNVKYVRENGILYRVDGDKKTAMNESDLSAELAKDNKTCLTTGVGKAGTGDCMEVFNCLLSGNPANLSRCLARLQNQDMFKVAKSDVEKMNPHIALRLLKTFELTPRKETSGLVLPPAFDEWLNNILPRKVNSDTLNAIKGNTQLLNYIKGVVSLVRSNPAIINANGSVATEVSDYAKKIGLTVFVQPQYQTSRSVVPSILEQGILMSRQSAPSLPLTLQLGNPFNNNNNPLANALNMCNHLPNVFNNMVGGSMSKPFDAVCVNANNLKTVFQTTYAEMERNGMQLADDDKATIDETIARVAKLETQLVRVLEELKIYNKLNSALSVPRGSVGIETVTLKDVVNRSEPTTANQLASLTQSASQNLDQQNSYINDLIFKVQRSLLDLLINGNSKILAQV